MPSLNPYALTALTDAHCEETRDFTDPKLPGVTLTITIRTDKDLTRTLSSAEKSQSYVQRYVTGAPAVGDDGKLILANGQPVIVPHALPAVNVGDRKVIPVPSELLCQGLAVLESLQVPGPGEERYTFEQWTAWCVLMPDAMQEVISWATSLTPGVDETKNGSGSDAAPSSEPA